MGGQRHAPADLPPGRTRYRLYRRLGLDGCGKSRSPPPGFDLRTVQPVASELLYRLCYLIPHTVYYTKPIAFFDVLLTVHLSIFILVINQLDAQNLFYIKFISCLYMFRAHVSIIRRSKLYHTASGIITLRQVSGLKFLKYIL